MKNMVYSLVFFMLMSFIFSSGLSAGGRESILGVWSVPAGDAHITIYQCGTSFCGKVSWLENPKDRDTENPDPARRDDMLLNKQIMWSFVFDDDEWVNGKIYDPDSGNTYSCKMGLEGKDVLQVKGYIGISLFGRAEKWKRVR